MPTTPNYGLPYPAESAAADPPVDIQALAEAADGALHTHATAVTLDHPDSSVTAAKIAASAATDTKIGTRTADPALVPTNLGPGTLTQWLGWITNRILAIHGGSNWYSAPVATISSIWDKFNGTTGHAHTASGNNGPKLAQANTHQSPDTDSATSALHHTLGGGANQAAPGVHSHGQVTPIRNTGTYTLPLLSAVLVGAVYRAHAWGGVLRVQADGSDAILKDGSALPYYDQAAFSVYDYTSQGDYWGLS